MIATYLLRTNCNKVYIGSTKDLKKRITTHLYHLGCGNHHNKKLQEVYDNGATLSISFIRCVDREQAYVLEKKLIDAFSDTGLLLNIGIGVKGGDNLTRNPNREDIIRRISETLHRNASKLSIEERKKRWSRPGELNPMYGRTHTDDARKRISEFNKGNSYALGAKRSDAVRKALSEWASQRTGSKNPFFGKHHTLETKRVIGARNRGKRPPNIRQVSIDGVTYNSQTEAAKKLNVAIATITYRLRSKNPKFSSYKAI